MARLERIYRCTASGLKAQAGDPALAPDELRILAIVGDEMHSDVIRAMLRRHVDHALLASLEARGFIASEAAAPGHDLDFTGSFAFTS